MRDEEFTDYARTRGPALVRTAFFLTGDHHRAEDLAQTALAQLYVHWERVREPAQRDAYVRRVLVNANAAWWRRRSASEVPVDPTAYAEREPLVVALRQLPAKQRAAVVLRYFEDRSEADTAAILACSAGSVKKHTSRGLDRLRTLLSGTDVAPLRVREAMEAAL